MASPRITAALYFRAVKNWNKANVIDAYILGSRSAQKNEEPERARESAASPCLDVMSADSTQLAVL